MAGKCALSDTAVPLNLCLIDRSRYSSQSTALNKSRLEVLRSRAEHLDTIFDETKTKVKDLSKDGDKYQSVLEGLILEVSISSLLLYGLI